MLEKTGRTIAIWNLLTVLASAAAASAGASEEPGGVIATVNGEPVHLEEVEQRLRSMHSSADAAARTDFDLDRLMFQVVNDVLLGQEARALEMDQDESIRRKVQDYQEKVLLRVLERREIDEKSRPTDEEVRRIYEEQYARINFQVVTSYDEPGADALRAELEAGADMEALARERSVDPYALRGGHVKDIARIDLQRDIAVIAFAMQPGELAGPIQTELGYSVIRVLSILPADPERFETHEGDCRKLARFLKANDLRERQSKKLQKDIPVEVDREAAQRITPERLPDSRLMPKVPDPEATIATVGERTISAARYAKALVGRWKGVRNEEAAVAAAPIILDNLVKRELLLAEAERRGYGSLPEVERAVRAHETQLLVKKYLEEVVAATVTVDAEEMRAFYQENKEQYHRPPRVRLGQITVETRDEAERVAEQLRKGSDLAWLARQHSIDGFKEKGGDKGWYVPQPGLDDYNDRLLVAPSGTVLEPFGMPGNFLVVKVLAREEQGIYEYGEISGNVRNAVFESKLRGTLTEFMDRLRERAEIEIDDEALARLTIRGAPDPEQGDGHGG